MDKMFATRLMNLGTETAFAVSVSAAEFKAKGNKVYPFHLGDMDIRTPLNIIEAAEGAMRDGKTGYVPAAGILPLRETIAEYVGLERGVQFGHENVAIQPGGKPVIGKFIQALMNPGDGVLYPNPGYPIYESQINYHGGRALPYGYISSGEGFKIDREQIEFSIDTNTKIFIYNNYQNPIGAESHIEEMEWIADFILRHNLWVLSDEAYFKIRYSGKSKSIVSFPGLKERTVILYSFSKTFAMTGWRLGAAVGPKKIVEIIAKLNVNQESCTNHFIQYAGIEALCGNQRGAEEIVITLQERRDVLVEELKKIDGVVISKPNTTFYLFPDITDVYHRMGVKSLDEFRIKTLESTGVSFCTREHFGTPLTGETQKFIRFAYSGISVEEIREGIGRLKDYWAIMKPVVTV
ncbi:MAG: aminotransferase class I/II-fold pyridoxal phosphate-dependent enzyme [Candidatus Marinimicrobia bacterium]|nr:aminotransferase class I/II-fold pyridoxal phosphate-dependent enzyme [Candidatus Neomarinimicrobiota bacterium]